MARPTTIRDEDLLEAARAVVRERGAAATTAEVAARAGVSEGTIFHRFKSKNLLFIEALLRAGDPEWVERLPARVGTGDVFEHLVEVGLEVVAYFREIMPMAMLAGSAPEDSGFHARLAASNSPKVRAERKMEAFFEAEARAGRLATPDAALVSRTYLGALWGYVFGEFQMRNERGMPTPPRVFVEGLVGLLKHGTDPHPSKRR
jgi:AcrR family transcriptional regulator